MQIDTFELEAHEPSSIMTEILYAIGCAKAKQHELLFLKAKGDDFTLVLSLLKKIKKTGKITLYLSSEDWENETTEAKYLQNKYTNLIFSKEDFLHAFIIKT